jgi:hypothetical protein
VIGRSPAEADAMRTAAVAEPVIGRVPFAFAPAPGDVATDAPVTGMSPVALALTIKAAAELPVTGKVPAAVPVTLESVRSPVAVPVIAIEPTAFA